jgi:hypothetical protein
LRESLMTWPKQSFKDEPSATFYPLPRGAVNLQHVSLQSPRRLRYTRSSTPSLPFRPTGRTCELP